MSEIKIKVSNKGVAQVKYYCVRSQGVLAIGNTREIFIDVGDTLCFEFENNSNNVKHIVTESDESTHLILLSK